MIRRAEGRSPALARAQAQLAGSRVAAREALEHFGNRPVHLAVRNSSDSCLSVPLASDLSNLSGISTQTRRKEMEDERLIEPLTLSRPPGRFLKQKPLETKDGGTAGIHPAAKTNPSTVSKGRSSAVLRKLAQIESKIRSHKVKLDTSEISQMLSEEELFWSESSQDPVQGVELRRSGLRSPKKEIGLKENIPVSDRFHPQGRNVPLGDKDGLDSEEDNERHFLGDLWKYEKEHCGLRLGEKSFLKSRIKFPPKTPSPPSLRSPLPARNYQKRLSHRTPSPPSKSTPREMSGLSLSSLKDSGPGASSPVSSIFPSGRSLSGRSIIRSLDELFSEAADTHSSSSSDFRVNVLSLDDLAPSMVSQVEEPKIKAKTMQAAGESSKEQAIALFPITTPSTFKATNDTMEKTATVEEDEEVEDLGETEISEQLNGSSEHFSRKQESSISVEYSDDFEPSVSEELESQYSSEESQGHSSSSVPSRPSNLSSISLPPAGTSTKPPRTIVKEAAVQTSCSSLTYHWLQTEAAATLGQTAGRSTVEAPPIASHVVSLDTVEALTTYSPAVFALNDLLKQNVLLIRQFVEFSRHLHNSVVASLEEEEFHYHTLEEAKAYIYHNKPPSLTVEQALQELEHQGQMAC